MRSPKLILVSALVLMCSACTEPGETTGIAAATGGVIGAGLGAIVGNQTGDPGSGLVIGAVAGASTGALVGNAIQAQQENIRTQDEAIERQERVIAAQKSELQELRRMNQDNPSYKRSLNTRIQNSMNSRPTTTTAYNRHPQPLAAAPKAITKDARASYYPQNAGATSKVVKERSITPEIPRVQEMPRENLAAAKQKSYSDSLYEAPIKPSSPKEDVVAEFDSAPAEEVQPVAVAQKANIAEASSTSECNQAEQEMGKSRAASDASDKLFHTRRAIRLCPDKASYHHALGEVYLSLNRKEDAEFEFQEALKNDPSFQPAKEGIQKVSSSASKPNKY